MVELYWIEVVALILLRRLICHHFQEKSHFFMTVI